MVTYVLPTRKIGGEEGAPTESLAVSRVHREKDERADYGQHEGIEEEPLLADEAAPSATQDLSDRYTSLESPRPVSRPARSITSAPERPEQPAEARTEAGDPMLYSGS